MAYPTRWESDIVLRDGATAHLRPIRPADAGAIRALYSRLSKESIYFRFFSPLRDLTEAMLHRLVDVDYEERLALVAELGDDILGVGRYEPISHPEMLGDAEVAFVVDDAQQGRGIGTALLEHLAVAAKEAGVRRFVADTLPDNKRMLRVFHEAGFGDERTFGDGVIRVTFPLAPTEASVAATDERERLAAASSVAKLLEPKVVAVIGASRRKGSLGHELFRSIRDSDFEGSVYPVNPSTNHLLGVRAYPTVMDVPDRVDLGVVVVSADTVPEVVLQCAKAGAGGLLVVTNGFADRDEEGLVAERVLVAETRRNGMRLIGPNSMGLLNNDPAVRLNATFRPAPPPGRIGFLAQSGGLGVAILDELARRRLGVSNFVSVGNKADISGNDMLHYWHEAPTTDVVLMYLESFGNPRTFARAAKRLAREKPVVAVKSARSTAGLSAAFSPEGGLETDVAVDALFRQIGIIRTDTLEEMFDIGQVLVSQGLPGGNRVAIVGNSGAGVLTADACAAAGLDVVTLSEATVGELRRSLPRTGRLGNPVDLPADAAPEAFERSISAVVRSGEVDSVIVLCTSPTIATEDELLASMVLGARGKPEIPLLACVLGRVGILAPSGQGDARVPSFAFPEAAARALGRVTWYADWRRMPEGAIPELEDVEPEKARSVAADHLSEKGEGWLSVEDAALMLECYRLPVLYTRPAGSAEEALTAAHDVIGFPVAVKATPRPGTTAVPPASIRLGIEDDEGVAQAFNQVDNGTGVTVQGMAGRGPAVVVSATVDPMFGSLISLATAGGVEGARGRSDQRVAPLTDRLASGLIRAVLPLGADDDDSSRRLADLLIRVGRMAEDVPELAELHLNPVILTADGPRIAGFAARMESWSPRPELALRRL